MHATFQRGKQTYKDGLVFRIRDTGWFEKTKSHRRTSCARESTVVPSNAGKNISLNFQLVNNVDIVFISLFCNA